MIDPLFQCPSLPNLNSGDLACGIGIDALRGRRSTVRSQGDRAELTPTKSDGTIFRFV